MHNPPSSHYINWSSHLLFPASQTYLPLTCLNLGFILWVVNPTTGSTQRLLAMSSYWASSLALISPDIAPTALRAGMECEKECACVNKQLVKTFDTGRTFNCMCSRIKKSHLAKAGHFRKKFCYQSGSGRLKSKISGFSASSLRITSLAAA